MATFRIEGQRPLSGEIEISGSKNSATKILVACLITSGTEVIQNVPNIEDVHRITELMSSIGAQVSWTGEHEVTIDAKNLNPDALDHNTVRKLRASILLMGALLGRFGISKMPGPGGDQIGARPLDTHFEAFSALGAEISENGGIYTLKRNTREDRVITMPEFSVTATENVILASVTHLTKTIIHCAAADPSVQDLCWFLVSRGAKISGIGTSSLTIVGVPELRAERPYSVMPDPVEIGTYMSLAGATHSNLTLVNATTDFLRMEMRKFNDVGVTSMFNPISNDGNYQIGKLEIHPSNELRAVRQVHNMPYPGFNPDILPPFSVLLTQAHGTSMVHDWMYDGRLKYVEELNKMGADIFISDPHRILVTGPRRLFGATITNYDIRTGASLLIAALVAEGQSTIAPAYQLDRGYEHIDKKLQAVGASIERIEL